MRASVTGFVLLLPFLLIPLRLSPAWAETVFMEAERFTGSSDGWRVNAEPGAAKASGMALLNGAGGARDATAAATVTLQEAGHYRVWVRYTSHPKWRGPFRVTVLQGDRELGSGLFDAEFEAKSARDIYTWRRFEADLPAGPLTLKLSKHENRNASGPARQVDCLLLTTDAKLVPDHLHYGTQTFLRVTVGEGYDRPIYLHVFADHYHAPWYQHYSIGRDGAVPGVAPRKENMLASGQQTAWCNITPMLYQDSGAVLKITARHSYQEYAERLLATFELATAANDGAVVRTIQADCKPAGLVVLAPPDLTTPEHRALLKIDREVAEETGRLADAHPWPTHGKPLERFPLFVSAQLGGALLVDEAVLDREQKTLSYFGFLPRHHREIRGAWHMLNDSYCQPDVEKMKARFATAADEFRREGGTVKDIVFCELTDEPGGQKLEFMAKDPAYAERFHAWLKAQGKTPADLLVNDWNAVRLVTADERDAFPALYYFSQRFRTRALGDFMATQRKIAEEAYGGTFPVLANFSDGAIYTGNFYAQGVDYFELLASPDQNAIWSEDWANGSSTYQCASFNVELMRAAARLRGQVIGHHLVAYAGRKPWDVKLKATSELARGVKILNSFFYGPSWAGHEGGPYWKSTAWYTKPPMWTAHAALTREVGAVEDLLLTAMPAPAKVALLYSSASDVWTAGANQAYGFDRMHTWLALAHAQVPVDVVSEQQAADGLLNGYRVCYLTGPNLARAAADRLKQWVEQGGTLWLTAGAASRDEFNRPLTTLDALLPAQRGEVSELQKYASSGRYLGTLTPKDEAQWTGGTADVLAVKQPLAQHKDATVLATFRDRSAALLRGRAGKGTVYCAGFLPALAYIKPALDARSAIQSRVRESQSGGAVLSAAESQKAAILDRSANPWEYPATVRKLLLAPVASANVVPPIACSVPLVDTVYMAHADGILIPLANYTLEPIERLVLKVKSDRPVVQAESARHGPIQFKQASPHAVELSLPLENNDFVKLRYQ